MPRGTPQGFLGGIVEGFGDAFNDVRQGVTNTFSGGGGDGFFESSEPGLIEGFEAGFTGGNVQGGDAFAGIGETLGSAGQGFLKAGADALAQELVNQEPRSDASRFVGEGTDRLAVSNQQGAAQQSSGGDGVQFSTGTLTIGAILVGGLLLLLAVFALDD